MVAFVFVPLMIGADSGCLSLVCADYAAANAVVECTHRYKKLFYDAGEDL